MYGVTLLPSGSRRQKLLLVAKLIFEEDLVSQVLAFDANAAVHYAEIAAARKSSGRPIIQFDAMIAARARLHGGKVVTRNVADFERCGVGFVNPWEA